MQLNMNPSVPYEIVFVDMKKSIACHPLCIGEGKDEMRHIWTPKCSLMFDFCNHEYENNHAVHVNHIKYFIDKVVM